MCLFSLMLIRCAICFSVNCFGIHMAGFPLLPKQTGTGRGQEDGETGSETSRETEKETEISQRLGNFKCLFSASGIFFGNFIEKLFSELKHPIFFYEDVVSFFPLFISAAHSTWSCLDPRSQWVSLSWDGWTPPSSTLRGRLFFLITTSLQHWLEWRKVLSL